MTENTGNDVLMKCEKCGYTERVPESDLEILRLSSAPGEEDHLLCPFCLHDMYRIDSKRFAKN